MTRYYAVKAGRAPGVYKTWEEAEAQVSGYSGANHRRFSDLRSAVDWVGIPIGQLASWVQGALSNDLHRQATPPLGSTASISSSEQHLKGETRMSQTNISVEDIMGKLRLGEVCRKRSVDHTNSLPSDLGVVASDRSLAELAAVGGFTPKRSSSLQTGQGSSEGPLSSTPFRHLAQAHQRQASPLGMTQNKSSTHTDTTIEPNYSIWSSTNHSGWLDDSLISGVFHPPASGPRGSPSEETGGDERSSESGVSTNENDIDPMLPSSTGLMGVADENTWNYRIHLRAASTSVTQYSSGLRYVLGRHAVNYLYMHYYSAGSAVAIADAYLDYSQDGESFVRLLVDRDMPPRHAAFLWTIISPEVLLGSSAVRKPYSQGEFSAEDDQDMSFVRSA